MSIIKTIFHRYNKSSQSYDTMHPETEYAQVTDFGQGVINTLIGTALASTISAVTSNSVFGKCLQKVLEASGMKYSLSQNGYICLGSFFGGLIVQWGTGNCNTVITLPIAFSAFKVPAAIHRGTVTNTIIIFSQDYATSLTQIKFLTNNSNDTAFVVYIIIGR